MMPAAANSAEHPGEAELWARHLTVLRQALRLRKPDARERIRGEAAKLEREIDAMARRRNLAAKAARWSDSEQSSIAGGRVAAELDAQIARRMRQVSDLAGLLHGATVPSKQQDDGGTAEAVLRPSAQDPVTMLHGKGKLSEDQVRAAREIAWVYQAITRAGRARVSRLSQIDPPAGWRETPMPERAALIYAKRFRPWAEHLRRHAPATLELALQVIVLGVSVYGVARAHRMSWNGCVSRLAGALDRYGGGRGKT